MKKSIQVLLFFSIFFFLLDCSRLKAILAQKEWEGISVARLNLFVDHYGGQHIIGTISNNSSFPLRSIVMRISAKDARGKTVLQNEKGRLIDRDWFEPFLKVLFPGQSSGFDYSLSPLQGTVSEFKVEFLSAMKAEGKPANVRVRQAWVQRSRYGTSFFIGELVNDGSQPAMIEGLGVAIVGEDGRILDTNHASTLVRYLAPSQDPGDLDRGAFSIPLRGSFGSDVHCEIFLSSVTSQRLDPPAAQVVDSHLYVDANGTMHLVGVVRNLSSRSIFFPINAALLDEAGNVMDSVIGYPPITLSSGTTVGFDLLEWNVVNFNPDLQKPVARARIQIDPSRILPSHQHYHQLFASNVRQSLKQEEGIVTFEGEVLNFWAEPRERIRVIVLAYAAENHLVAMNYQVLESVYPFIQQGRISHFSVPVYLDPHVDPAEVIYQLQVFVRSFW